MLVSAPSPKNFKFAPIQKRFRDSGSASLCEPKFPPQRFPNPQVIIKIQQLTKLNLKKNCFRPQIFKKINKIELEKIVFDPKF